MKIQSQPHARVSIENLAGFRTMHLFWTRIPVRQILVSWFAASVIAGFWATQASGQSVSIYEKRVTETITRVQVFHHRIESLQRAPNLPAKKREMYTSLAKQLSTPAEYAHIQFPTDDYSRPWLRTASKVARGIKPNVNYLVKKGGNDTVITGSDAAIKNLYNNVKMIAWYHDQLDKHYSETAYNHGSVALARLLDEFLLTLAKAQPEIKIRKRGRINLARDQELNFSEKKLWQLLSVINRYFFYKVQLNDDRKDFYPADFLLMNSLIQTAALYGAQPPNNSLREIDVELRETAAGWRKAGYEALESWEMHMNNEFPQPQHLCVVKIPSKHKPKPPAANPPANNGGGFPSDVEDIKELGGQIFIKRKGHWQPWKK